MPADPEAGARGAPAVLNVHPAPESSLAPPHAPLAMPQQRLSAERVALPPEHDERWRLWALLGPALMVTLLATSLSHSLLSADGMSALEWISLALFAANLAWITSAAATAVAGAVILLTAPKRQSVERPFRTRSRTAIVFPIRNEHPGRVMGGAQAVHDSLARADADEAFEIFFLSDTTDAPLAREEEAAFRRLRQSRPAARMFYRRRTANHGRKAGNVADFVRNWGGRYDYMVVFDADSLMSARALTQLVQRMDDSPRTALVQTLPLIVNAQTLFARSQQFAMRTYGQIFGAGLAWWSGGAGNFWGHNAIIRVAAFAAHAGLPVLPGTAPLGGPIMSHDFVEAALLRRASWRIEIAPDMAGSYEECPPTLADMEQRDRRWAQGNMQHLSLLGAKGFDPVSRTHIIAGVMGYLSAPLWLTLIVTSVAFGWIGGPVAEDTERPVGRVLLMIITALIVFSPKILALLVWSAGRLPGWPQQPRFIAGVMLETAVSAATAPILMVSQTVAVISTLMGRDAGWRSQSRHTGASRETSRYSLHLAIGLALGTAVIAHDIGMAAWTAPVALSLIFAGAISGALAQTPRRRSALWRLMATPEDITPPKVVRAALRAGMTMGAAETPALVQTRGRDAVAVAAVAES